MDQSHKNPTMSIWPTEVKSLLMFKMMVFSLHQALIIHVGLVLYDSVFDFSDLYYFLLAPTLCYQRDFPCSPKVHINKLLHRLMEMVIWKLWLLYFLLLIRNINIKMKKMLTFESLASGQPYYRWKHCTLSIVAPSVFRWSSSRSWSALCSRYCIICHGALSYLSIVSIPYSIWCD